jgi:ABC-type glycerol-3-phosphate transport system permease component
MVRIVPGQPGSVGSPAGLPSGAPPGSRQRGVIFIRRHRLAPYLLLLPSAAVIAVLVLRPTIQIAEFSFQNYGLPQLVGSEPTQWVGFSNYAHVLHDPEFWLSLRLSVLSAVAMVPLTLIVGTLVGVLLSRLGRKMAAFVSSVSVLAWATPAVSASVIFVWLATPDGGVVDWFLTKLPRELEEAAAIDGAGPVRVFWRILLPLVAPGLVATSVFAFVFAYNEFVFALTFLGADTAKFTLPIYVQYFYGRNGADWGAIMAASTLFTIPVMAFFLLVQRRLRAGLVAGAVKG